MLKGVTRLVFRVHKLNPRCFLHSGTQATQSTAAQPDEQVPVERPRTISRTNESDPAQHGEQHYSIPLQDLKTALPPRPASSLGNAGEDIR
ncbi:28S ribosomal protein S29, mitochondrial [Heterocephalus glaber]|uniref:28S ribosomal protein S29, mitochondrial n=1 Tax=Heterocephalus glaber TaxID=10181 RepID=G5ALQ1_HETGA|nr:28S ribosomal protein S29, mitochondrial [Heterocephalus glaber]